MTMKYNRWVVLLVAVGFLASFQTAGAATFHINAEADVLTATGANAYVGGSIASVTRAFGSPSVIRHNVSDPSGKIDYMYVGNSQVVTFVASKASGKAVLSTGVQGRGAWEAGAWLSYPPKS